ncbi:ABC transporter permease [Kribbella pratensis]|jgi:ABC-type Na+ efflux pump permease subunit|uniref:ABC-2 type transport system permease protein n=1 Tax=Kribbella pratensis TaxID=2512112 RepID=A0A4R8CCJ9_9ACTN|nr:ABC transporter permease subunit [Kribbella pratensis]TDW71333.1 ABC-2 type transport system permease protein [Kribbella pratensis]
MTVNPRLVRAVVDKELREFRRNRSMVVGMAIIPLIFSVQPLVTVFALSSSASGPLRHEHVLLYMLGIPALVPSLVASYSVVGEREQGTLEPLLTTPIRREELLLGKALATFIPAAIVAYAVFALFLACVGLFAQPSVASALIRPSDVIAQLVFTPLLAGWSIWVAIVISTRANDIRVAQQLSTLASLPSVALAILIALNVIDVSLLTGVVAAAVLLALNRIGWRVASALFDRERLILGTKA